ncbi:MAG: TspO/MBR family protein [Aquincola tertiaricarbonis]|uniref:TspO/MBR family protein n=1 Tax=Aquincola sp. J276 TaxID=2898432 RepID=UPI0021515EAC|nr:TspO/MBR family protein [Aquincola sp. J276]MCR5868055.1 tryptophan-rich sensory protein [Aquincola sp. J276]
MTGRPLWKPLSVAVLGAVALSVLGGLATDIGPWYRGLAKPAWQPPDWLFGPVWTTIYALGVVAAVRAWRAPVQQPGRGALLTAFGANGIANVLWSVLFFAMRRPDWAAFEVVLLWLSIAWLIRVAGRRDRLAGWLLAPYLAWVSFAAVLNLTIVRLNPPFA